MISLDRSKEKGDHYLEGLNKLIGKIPNSSDRLSEELVLLICMEFPEAEVGYEVTKGLFARHVMTAGTLVNAKTVRIEPPINSES